MRSIRLAVLAGFAFFVYKDVAQARIGESETQLENRFGGSQQGFMYGDLPLDLVIRKYHKDGFIILVAFYKGRSQREEYSKVGTTFSEGELTTILQNNACGSTWVEKRDTDHFQSWETKDAKTSAVYSKDSDSDQVVPYVAVETADFRTRANAAADVKKSRENGASGL